MVQLKVTQIGNSVGVVLPKEALARLNVSKGDSVYLIENGVGYLVSAYDPEFLEDILYAEEASRKYRNALKKLAK